MSRSYDSRTTIFSPEGPSLINTARSSPSPALRLHVPGAYARRAAGWWGKNRGFQLYVSDPSGNYGGWRAAAVGANNQAAQSILNQEYKDDASREEVVELALKVLRKTMDSTSLTSEKLELAEVFLTESGSVEYLVHSPESVTKLLVKHSVTQPAAKTS